MSNQTIINLRQHLFNALEALSDKDNPMDIDRAKAICEVSQVIINSAKVEVDFMRHSGSDGTGFLERVGEKNNVTTHRIK